MSDNSKKPGQVIFATGYAEAIARAANLWAALEYHVNQTIWLLADVKPALGACITSHIFTIRNRLDAVISLAKVRRIETVDKKILQALNEFAEKSRDAQEARNRLVHDYWLNASHDPSMMGKLRITAAKQLKFDIEPVELSAVQADVAKIEKRFRQFVEIQKTIASVLHTLPKMSPEELFPIGDALQGP